MTFKGKKSNRGAPKGNENASKKRKELEPQEQVVELVPTNVELSETAVSGRTDASVASPGE